MRPGTLVLSAAVMAGCGMAQRFTFASDCDDNAKRRISQGVSDAVQYVKKAALVLESFSSDKHVQDMTKLVFGEGQEYKDNMDAYKIILQMIGKFETSPVDGGPDGTAWKTGKKNTDLEVHCSTDQIVPYPKAAGSYLFKPQSRILSKSVFDKVEKCHDKGYKPGPGTGATLAFVISSDRLNVKNYEAAVEDAKKNNKPTPKRSAFTTVYKSVPNVMNVCETLFTREGKENWEGLTQKRIDKARDKDWLEANLKGMPLTTPVDLLKPFGVHILHELSHTNQGGKTRDIPKEELGDIPTCYHWSCLTKLKRWENADSVAMMTLALNLWEMGYYVDDKGYIQKK